MALYCEMRHAAWRDPQFSRDLLHGQPRTRRQNLLLTPDRFAADWTGCFSAAPVPIRYGCHTPAIVSRSSEAAALSAAVTPMPGRSHSRYVTASQTGLKTPCNPQAYETHVQIDNSGDGVIRFDRSHAASTSVGLQNVKFGFQQLRKPSTARRDAPRGITFECGNRLLCIDREICLKPLKSPGSTGRDSNPTPRALSTDGGALALTDRSGSHGTRPGRRAASKAQCA
jgi:hypothetical protein